VKPSAFVHHAPRSVDEALALLAEYGHDGKVLAGGQSLIPILNMRLAAPGHLVDINRITGLDTVEITPDTVHIGALVRHAQLERHVEAFAHLPLLRQALVNVAHPVIRNRGTTVGSIAHADPSGEMPAVLALTGGYVDVASSRGTRTIAASDFFLGPLESALAEDEMATRASFGCFPAGTGMAFAESARRHGDYALAGVAAAVTVRDGVITSMRRSSRSRPPPTCWTSPTSWPAVSQGTATGPRLPGWPASMSTRTPTSTRVASTAECWSGCLPPAFSPKLPPLPTSPHWGPEP